MTRSTSQSPEDSSTGDLAVEADAHLELLKGLCRGLAKALGPNAEVVVHDFRHPDDSIVAIAGDVTDRSIGGSMTRLGLQLAAAGDEAEDQYDYITRTESGRVLRSSTLVLRDTAGRLFGALCINVDVTEYRRLADVVSELAGVAQSDPEPVMFSDDLMAVVRQALAQAARRSGVPTERLAKSDREDLMRELDGKGVFAMQRAVPVVAKELGVSRATVYSDLGAARRSPTSTAGSPIHPTDPDGP